jgi:hypothetical protein
MGPDGGLTINTWNAMTGQGSERLIVGTATIHETGSYLIAGGQLLMGGSFRRGQWNGAWVTGRAGDQVPFMVRYDCGVPHRAAVGVFGREEDVPRRFGFWDVAIPVVMIGGVVVFLVYGFCRGQLGM